MHLFWHAICMGMLKRAMDESKLWFLEWELYISNLLSEKNQIFHFSKDLWVNSTFEVFSSHFFVKMISHSENHDLISSIAVLNIPIYMACQNKCIIYVLNIPLFSVALQNSEFCDFLQFYAGFLWFHKGEHFTFQIGEKVCKFNIFIQQITDAAICYPLRDKKWHWFTPKIRQSMFEVI